MDWVCKSAVAVIRCVKINAYPTTTSVSSWAEGGQGNGIHFFLPRIKTVSMKR